MKNYSLDESKNRNSILAGALAVALILSLGFGYKMYSRWRVGQIQTEAAQFYITPTPSPAVVAQTPSVIYTKPVIGMEFSDFGKLCGQPDDIRTIQDQSGETIIYEYALSSERGKTKCYGTFTFTDYKLKRISR